MKHWIEVWNKNQMKPSLQDITDRTQAEVRAIIEFFDEEYIPWAFGCGEVMPDALPKEGRE
jgi:hypothetical protein